MSKVLFVTHDISDYGAARSLQEVLLNHTGDHYLLVILPYFKGDPDKALVSKKFNIPEDNIFYKFGYTSDEYLGGPRTFKRSVIQSVKKFLLNFQLGSIDNIISDLDISHVYLNSLTLYPYIQSNDKCDYTIHIRERLDTKSTKNVYKALNLVQKVIYIDQATKEALDLPYKKKEIILTDPVDMSKVHTPETKKACKDFLPNIDLDNKTVFSMIGKIDFWDKGTGFVLENFIKLDRDDFVLLIIGAALPWTNDREKCLEIIGNNKNIHLVGEVSDQSIIYGLTDVVVRAEEKFAVGRTQLEGLRSGCEIIMPGEENNLPGNNLEFAIDKIHLYPGRDKDQFMHKVTKLIGYKKTKVPKSIASTVEVYNNDFFTFIEG
jgi:hypothetical protein